jgi:hypothetical protein
VEGCTTTPGSENIAKAVEELRVLSEYSELVGFSKHMVFFPSLARGLYFSNV